MRRTASSGSPRLEVQRHFESSRLAKDCQARAYELVSVGRPPAQRTGTREPRAEEDRPSREVVSQRGVAA